MDSRVSSESPEVRSAGAAPGDLERAELLRNARDRIRAEISKVIVGQNEVVELLIVSLFAGGHSILIGVPGLAKTLLVSTLARVLSLSFKRVQFTPDLMPSDITGTDIIQEDPATGVRSFRFVRGPIFANMLLADEINRTPPKTQAALLEAMQERQVTVGEQTYKLPSPFFVVATQNPIEQEGTYSLPEAQLDRFLLAIRVPYPSEDEELEIMKRTTPPWTIPLEKVLDAQSIVAIQELVSRVPTPPHVYELALRLARATRPEERTAPPYVKDYVSWGVGPRAAQNLILAARARALFHGRLHANAEDVERLAAPVLAHRIVTNFKADSEGVRAEEILARLLRDIPRPREKPAD